MIVDFMIIGSMKSGTTTLSNILMKHDQVSFCKRKEPDFFSTSINWKKELKNYEDLFSVAEGKIYGEGSTSYTKYPDYNLEIWKDIYEYNPNMKFIYLVRNPIQRAISHYMHIYVRGYTKLSLAESIKQIPDLINYSRYYTQIRPFIQLFGSDNVMIVDFDDLNEKRSEVLKNVADFLSINYGGYAEFEGIQANASLGEPNKIDKKFDFLNESPVFLALRRYLRSYMPDELRKKIWSGITYQKSKAFNQKPVLAESHKRLIINLLEIEISGLEKYIKKDLSHWLKINKV